MRQRAAVIIIDETEGKVLLMCRHKYGRCYYVVPGGGVEAGETPAEAAIREAKEETGLDVVIERQVCEYVNHGQPEHYFLAASFSGELCLGGPEVQRQSRQNVYLLEWVPLSKLDDIPLMPKSIREYIFSLFSR
jgi:8-oxo-dGTP pyrophosphatase MutT (NUDIX family)